jgi:hypothetical protein
MWLVNVNRNTVEVWREPSPDGYRAQQVVDRTGTAAALAFPDVPLAVQDLVG